MAMEPYDTFKGSTSSWECVAFDGQLVPHGQTYVPTVDFCLICKCEEGKRGSCQAVLCQHRPDCKTFKRGEGSCCDIICVDDLYPMRPYDVNGSHVTTDLGLRMVASAVTAILSLALLLFLIHRLRQRRLRAQQQYYEDPDSPVGPNIDTCHNNACCHNAAYCNGNDHVDFFLDGNTPPYSLWKPPSFYFPHEDAPPPYSEVVASSYRLSESTDIRTIGPLLVQLGPAFGESSDDHGVMVRPSDSRLLGERTPFRATLNSDDHGVVMVRPSVGHNPFRATLDRAGITIRSDEVYEDVHSIPDDRPPPYCPLAQPLNDLNRGTEVDIVEDQAIPRPETVCEGEDGSVECSCSADDQSCSICSHSDSAGADNNNTTQREPEVNQSPVRLRTRDAVRVTPRGSNRTSTMEEFQLRLSMDISDSSTSSEGPTRTFSSSSDDSTSMDTSEMR